MLFSIDRIVGKTAELVGEDRKMLTVPSKMLPKNARAGDMLRYENGVFLPAPDAAAARRAAVSEMLSILLHTDDE